MYRISLNLCISSPFAVTTYLCGSHLHWLPNIGTLILHIFAVISQGGRNHFQLWRRTALRSTDRPVTPIAAQAQVGIPVLAMLSLHASHMKTCRCCGEQCIESGETEIWKTSCRFFPASCGQFWVPGFPGLCVSVWPLFLTPTPSNLRVFDIVLQLLWDFFFSFWVYPGGRHGRRCIWRKTTNQYIRWLVDLQSVQGPFGLTRIGIEDFFWGKNYIRTGLDPQDMCHCIHKISSPFFWVRRRNARRLVWTSRTHNTKEWET